MAYLPARPQVLPSIAPPQQQQQPSYVRGGYNDQQQQLLQHGGGGGGSLERRLAVSERASKALLEETGRLQADFKNALREHHQEFERERQERSRLDLTVRNHMKALEQQQRLTADLQQRSQQQGGAAGATAQQLQQLQAGMVALQRDAADRRRAVDTLGGRLQQLEQGVQARLGSDAATLQKQGDILELLASELKQCKTRCSGVEQGLAATANSARDQGLQLAQELRSALDTITGVKNELLRSTQDTQSGMTAIAGDVARARSSLDNVIRRVDSAEAQALDMSARVGARLEGLAAQQREASNATSIALEGVKRGLAEQHAVQDSDRQRLADVVKKSMEVQALKQSDLETRLSSGLDGKVSEVAQMVKTDRQARQAFEHASKVINDQRSRALATEIANAQGMLQTSAQAIQTETQNSIARLHESIQLVERAMDGSRNELAQVLDAEIRTRQKQENKTEVMLQAIGEQVSAYRNGSDRAIQDVAALATKVSEETRSLAKREALAVKDMHARLSADVDTRFSMVMVQLARQEQVSGQITSDIGGQIEVERKTTDSTLQTLQERMVAQLKLIEARLESLPAQVEQTNQRVQQLRSETQARVTTEMQDRLREMDLVRLSLARKVDQENLDRATDHLRERVAVTEQRSHGLQNQVSGLDQELAGAKAALSSQLMAEQSQRAENDEELRQEMSRAVERTHRNVHDMQHAAYSPRASPRPPGGGKEDVGGRSTAMTSDDDNDDDDDDDDDDNDDDHDDDDEGRSSSQAYGTPTPELPRARGGSLNGTMSRITEGGENDESEEEEDTYSIRTGDGGGEVEARRGNTAIVNNSNTDNALNAPSTAELHDTSAIDSPDPNAQNAALRAEIVASDVYNATDGSSILGGEDGGNATSAQQPPPSTNTTTTTTPPPTTTNVMSDPESDDDDGNRDDGEGDESGGGDESDGGNDPASEIGSPVPEAAATHHGLDRMMRMSGDPSDDNLHLLAETPDGGAGDNVRQESRVDSRDSGDGDGGDGGDDGDDDSSDGELADDADGIGMDDGGMPGRS